METTSPFPEKETCLLTLARSELSTSKTTNNDDKDTLVLMQLPSSLVVSELQGACIIASPSQQACLVLNDKSYTMSRVETSNAYIMVPPPSNPQERPCKRTKTDTPTLVSIPVTLLQSGGSGASFLQLEPKHLNLALLEELLEPHVLDPYSFSISQNDEWRGRSCSSLAVDLQCSEPQVLDGLKRIQALGIVVSNDDNDIQYGFLSEEALLDAKRNIVATLMECDEFHDYAVSGISQQECIQQVLQRAGESYKYMEQVMKHTLQTLESDTISSNVDTDKIYLDVKKVAVCVVHCLFSKQSEPWDEQELLQQWQREVPCVGDIYQVSLEMLSGVALYCSVTKKCKYFPEQGLSTDVSKRFDALFEEREKWTLDELKPYVQRLLTEDVSETDLLLKYTRPITEHVDGKPTKLYVKL